MKYIKLYEEFNSFELNEEQKAFLDKLAKGRWEFNNGLININGNFICNSQNLTSFKEIKFGEISGGFICYNNKLTSLEGAPIICNELNCSINNLISLKGGPERADGSFICSNNYLTSLEGCPTNIRYTFNCSYNQLTSLKGCPNSIGGDIFCSGNYISEEGIKLVINNTIKNKNYQTGLILSLSDLSEEDLSYLTKDLEYSEELENIIRNNHKSEFLINILKEYNKPLYDKLTFVDKEKSDKMHDMGFND